MKININGQPPTDIFRDRGKYIWISLALMSLVVCGVLLMVYGFVSDTPPSDTLETVALTLLGAPAVIFVYFGGKLRAYIKLNQGQKTELADLVRKHAEISTYCELVAKQGREPILAEYEACKDWAEDLHHQQERSMKK